MPDITDAIRDDEQHAAALVEIKRLWNAEEATPEGDRLELLMTLVDAYERAKWP